MIVVLHEVAMNDRQISRRQLIQTSGVAAGSALAMPMLSTFSTAMATETPPTPLLELIDLTPDAEKCRLF